MSHPPETVEANVTAARSKVPKLVVLVILMCVTAGLILSPVRGQPYTTKHSEAVLLELGPNASSVPLRAEVPFNVEAVSPKLSEGPTSEPTEPTESSSIVVFTRPTGENPPACGIQPNQTDVDPYDKCPLPGLNNLLYTQINRWYCAFRDKRHLRLRDRSCQSLTGTAEPFRFSNLIQIDYRKVRKSMRSASVCWGDWPRQDKSCEWRDIPGFYGTPEWWLARSYVDFHQEYYRIADLMLRRSFAMFAPNHTSGIPPFLTVHLRRGDYDKHCIMLMSQKSPAWLSFRRSTTLGQGMEGCFPSLTTVGDSVRSILRKTGLQYVFVATNTPKEVVEHLKGVKGVLLMNQPAFDFAQYEAPPSDPHTSVPLRLRYQNSEFPHIFRQVDRIVVEMCIMSRGSHFLFNRYSSLSATVYEQARIHGRILNNDTNVIVW